MVALRVPIDAARTLAVEDGQPANDLHLTLAYLGKADDMTSEQFQLLHDICAAIAATEAPISGEVQGYGVFTETEDGPCLYASYDSPALPALRQTIMEALQGAGLPVHEDHGFTPHITIAYGESAPPGPVPSTPITFNGLTVTLGGTEAWIKFGSAIAKYSEDQARDDHGKFAEMGRGRHGVGSVKAVLGWEPTDDADRARLGDLLQKRGEAIERIGKGPGWKPAKSWEEMTPADQAATRAAYIDTHSDESQVTAYTREEAGKEFDEGALDKLSWAKYLGTITQTQTDPPSAEDIKNLVVNGDEGVEAFSQEARTLEKTKKWLNDVVARRTAELAGIPLAKARDVQRLTWEAWKGNSLNEGSLAMRGGAASKLGAVENPIVLQPVVDVMPGSSPNHMVSKFDPGYVKIAEWAEEQRGADIPYAERIANGKKITGALAQAQWETTQYALAKAGIDHLDVYRAVVLPKSVLGSVKELDTPTHSELLPDLALQRNSLSSWTETPRVANGWQGLGEKSVDPSGERGDFVRVVLRARIPAVGVFSIPAFGKTLYNEREVVALGTPVEAWDAFKRAAPPISSKLANFKITHEIGHINDSGRTRFGAIGAHPKKTPMPLAARDTRTIDRPGGYIVDLDEPMSHWLAKSVALGLAWGHHFETERIEKVDMAIPIEPQIEVPVSAPTPKEPSDLVKLTEMVSDLTKTVTDLAARPAQPIVNAEPTLATRKDIQRDARGRMHVIIEHFHGYNVIKTIERDEAGKILAVTQTREEN